MSEKPNMVGWTPEQVKAYEAAMAALQAEERQASEQAAQQKVDADSPETLIAAAQEKAATVKRERERAAQQVADDRAYARAVKEQGGEHRVARILTHEGSVILVPMTAPAWEYFRETVEGYTAPRDIDGAARESICNTLYHPDRTRFDELVAKFPGIWAHLFAARNALVDGVQEEARKNV
jgi:hypothetical protein